MHLLYNNYIYHKYIIHHINIKMVIYDHMNMIKKQKHLRYAYMQTFDMYHIQFNI